MVKDKDGIDIDVHVYRSMIGSLVYLTASRPDIMFAVCTCARHQVHPKASHLNAVKRIFREASLDRKLTIGGCQFLGRRLISWQCKKQTIVSNSNTEAEYVVAANCYGQSTISVIKNPVTHSRTKHIEIRFHFIRDCYEKRLIEVIKIHTASNIADILTKRFDVTRFKFLVTDFANGDVFIQFFRISMDLRMDRSCAANSSYTWSKPNESVGFTEVVDFLKGTSLRYALTHNPTIYDSLVKQFWQTATVRTLANGTQQLIASIDSKEYTITEASVRSKLQLADATGIHNLSDAEIYDGLATLGPKSGGWDQFGSTIATALIWDFVPLLPAMLAGAAMDPGEGSAQPVVPHHIPIDPLPSTSLPHIQSPPHSPIQSLPHSPHQSPPYSPH
ncbi:hypothetical protein Tco_1364848 [Tanacetum coccineum]